MLGQGDEQWIISAHRTNPIEMSQVLAEVITLLRSRPDVAILNIIGSEASPRQVVIRTSASTIAELQTAFYNRIIIAPDKPLQIT